MRDIGTLAGGSGMACCVNGKGQVVGWCTTETSEEYARLGFPYEDQPKRAFLFSDGKMDDLNAMIDPASGWRLHRAAGINDAGQIVGSGEDQAWQPHAFLLTPVPRRSPPVLWGLGIAALLALAWRIRLVRKPRQEAVSGNENNGS